ncbi:DUF3422 domain-containing protein [Ideonella sp. B7]|uniref:DUF3422 domain-containing protein n=1 Tax=Ideonella benzenivorans TaxID=2831643 RepID=UPI001CED77D9|nr:DUF3422 domain-containing protein [Ideonella benzenivorans]MCA6215061.1 DUF3422 domain-containing protein [Ideonella benzenivorans]
MSAEIHPEAPAAWPARQHTALHDELHARPPLLMRPGSVVSAWVNWQMDPQGAERALAGLCATQGQPTPQPGTRHHVLVTEDWTLKFERHGEFISWQMCRLMPALGEAPDSVQLSSLWRTASACAALPDSFVRALYGENNPGALLSAAHVLLLPADDSTVSRCRHLLERPDDDLEHPPLIGSHIADGGATLFTRLELGADGFVRYILLDHGLPPDQAARAVQRVCEMEAYRMLAMLGFPVAQQEAGELAALEGQLQGIVDAMSNEDQRDDAGALEALTRLAAEVEHSASRTRYRFSATRAYHAIVEDRVNGLREQRIPGLRTLAGFLGRRFEPAMALCDSTDRRLTDVAERINRALSLARVRVEITREASNQALFRALVHRQHLQLQLQQTVEGLSVVAISYYALSLVGYLAKAAKTLPVLEPYHLQPEAVVGIAVVPVVAAVAWFVHRIRVHHAVD